jgi:hypothetical protein
VDLGDAHLPIAKQLHWMAELYAKATRRVRGEQMLTLHAVAWQHYVEIIHLLLVLALLLIACLLACLHQL